LLEALDEGLNQIDEGERDAEIVNAVFRAVHSIKGGAGAFGLNELVAFAHTFETVFDEVRSDRLELEPALIKTLFRGADHLVQLVEAARAETAHDEQTHDAILEDLKGYLESEDEEEEVEFEPMALDFSASIDLPEPSTSSFTIQFAPHESLFKNGHDPVFLFRALSELGEVTVVLDHSDVPDIAKLDPMDAYLKWSLNLETLSGEGSIREVFEFVEGLCDLEIESLDEDVDQPVASDSPEEQPRLPGSETPESQSVKGVSSTAQSNPVPEKNGPSQPPPNPSRLHRACGLTRIAWIG